MAKMMREAARMTGLEVRIVAVENQFFGPLVTVAGLLTAQDTLDAIAARFADFTGDDLLLLPRVMLDNAGARFLDDLTVEEFRAQAPAPVIFAKTADESGRGAQCCAGVRRYTRWSAGMRMMRRSGWFAALMVALFAVAACGSQGQPSALGKPASATLTPPSSTQSVGVAHLTPVYGSHIAPNFQGQAIPYANAQNPVQLRKGACNGEVLAALTEGAPGPATGRRRRR